MGLLACCRLREGTAQGCVHATGSLFYRWPAPPVVALPASVQGAQTSIYCATSPELGLTTGKYYDKCRPVASSRESYDTGVTSMLWDVSSELVGL